MKRRFWHAPLAMAVVGIAAFAAPTAASASTLYPPSDACSVSPSTMTAGSTVTFECGDGTFGAAETVTITVTGENGAGVEFGFVKFAVSTGSTTRTSTATGALEGVTITLPADASGVYNFAAISPTSAGGAASTTVTAADGSLPVTGADSARLIGLWVGGGVLLLAGAVIVAVTVARRRRERD
ncbi:cell wall protein [Microbacterium fluvii]|uniref:Cell wall protein n=1 Tax=Microbacterium fluvii TaxID=415215 RepID=A0ABW2H918_9MICO|nr:cell wall protein [Microbacterium fluvii]MCU4671142.1 cell wall protein [Microbacterium fluvii]